VSSDIFNSTRTPSLEPFPGDSYPNVWKLFEGLRRLRRGWERYRRGESGRMSEKETEMTGNRASVARARQEVEAIGDQ